MVLFRFTVESDVSGNNAIRCVLFAFIAGEP
jgi:hypothetical protein